MMAKPSDASDDKWDSKCLTQNLSQNQVTYKSRFDFLTFQRVTGIIQTGRPKSYRNRNEFKLFGGVLMFLYFASNCNGFFFCFLACIWGGGGVAVKLEHVFDFLVIKERNSEQTSEYSTTKPKHWWITRIYETKILITLLSQYRRTCRMDHWPWLVKTVFIINKAYDHYEI